MKTIVCNEPNDLVMREDPEPVAGEGEALVRIRRVGICGTDLHAFQGDQPFFSYPRVLGHELAGEVVTNPGPGPGPGEPAVVLPYVQCGACVACRRGRPNCCANLRVLGVHADGGMRELMPVPASHLVAAEGLDWDQRALVECLSIGAHAVRRAEIEEGEWVVVIGCGPIGLGILQFARLAGGKVVGVDKNPARLAFWRSEFDGAHTFLVDDDPLERLDDLTGGERATAVFDATGHAGSMSASLEYVAHGGRLIYVGLTTSSFSFVHPEFHKRETTLLASRNALRADFDHVITALREGDVRSSCLVTHRTTLDGVVSGFPEWIRPETGAIKVLVDLE